MPIFSGGGGGGASVVLSASAVIPNASILTLPSTTVQVLAPTWTNPGFNTVPPSLPVVVAACAFSNFTGAVYTNTSAPTHLDLVYGAEFDYTVALASSRAAFAALNVQGIFQAADRNLVPFTAALNDGVVRPNASLSDNGIYLAMEAASGDLTGGDAANTLTVRLFYVVASL